MQMAQPKVRKSSVFKKVFKYMYCSEICYGALNPFFLSTLFCNPNFILLIFFKLLLKTDT